jgi:hypothetical protein
LLLFNKNEKKIFLSFFLRRIAGANGERGTIFFKKLKNSERSCINKDGKQLHKKSFWSPQRFFKISKNR